MELGACMEEEGPLVEGILAHGDPRGRVITDILSISQCSWSLPSNSRSKRST